MATILTSANTTVTDSSVSPAPAKVPEMLNKCLQPPFQTLPPETFIHRLNINYTGIGGYIVDIICNFPELPCCR